MDRVFMRLDDSDSGVSGGNDREPGLPSPVPVSNMTNAFTTQMNSVRVTCRHSSGRTRTGRRAATGQYRMAGTTCECTGSTYWIAFGLRHYEITQVPFDLGNESSSLIVRQRLHSWNRR